MGIINKILAVKESSIRSGGFRFSKTKHRYKATSLMALLFLCSSVKDDNNQANAIVNKIDGYLIFIESKPVVNYMELGAVNAPSLVWEGTPKELMKISLKRLKKNYPKADAILFKDHTLTQAIAIQFID